MLCRVPSGRFLFHTRLRSAAIKPFKSKSPPIRQVATDSPEEPTTPWSTSWLGPASRRNENNGPPISGDIALWHLPEADDNGVFLDRHGQLEVINPAKAKKDCRTALILTAASVNLTKADFMRTLPRNDSTEEHSFEGPSVPLWSCQAYS